MTSSVEKLRSIYRSGGIRGLVSFIFTRVVRRREYVVFVKHRPETEGLETVPEAPSNCRVIVARGADDLDRERIGSGEADTQEYIEGIKKGDVVGIFILEDGTIANRGFLMRFSRMLDILGAPDGAMLLGNGYTLPKFRRRGYQKLSIVSRLNEAWSLGARMVIAETDPDNVPSMKAHESAGLKRSGTVSVLIIGNRLVFRRASGTWQPARIGWCRPNAKGSTVDS